MFILLFGVVQAMNVILVDKKLFFNCVQTSNCSNKNNVCENIGEAYLYKPAGTLVEVMKLK